RQKEVLKKMRAEVDVLTLTATPIPRTLNMSLSGLRDLSIIATPPSHRHAIKTFVGTWDTHTIREACLRELKRGGQVFLLHNEVRSIEKTAREIRKLLPNTIVGVAHGQMPEQDLERVMVDFYHQRFNVLVCTTIIENGIDIPSANTIIVNRADKLGLSQLHQIRGRVGRSSHRAYAYLIAPPKSAMSENAVKRLEAIEALEELGAGFTVATHDLEIRGAGELLGAEQSGQIHEIGFSLYNQLLARTVAALKAGEIPSADLPPDHGTEVDLGVPALLPEDYVPDVHTRLMLYKRIASARNTDDLNDLEVELIDRFGLLPEYAKNLFSVTQVKLVAEHYDVTRIRAGSESVHLSFAKSHKIDVNKLLALVQENPSMYKLSSAEKLTIYAEMEDVQQRVETIGGLLNGLELKQAA
ncbi:MAG: helicase-related protein, partial [Gammaproteobacteria bacterium]|nr:helicase-related protein [Gammaproteobacteria bacterium]